MACSPMIVCTLGYFPLWCAVHRNVVSPTQSNSGRCIIQKHAGPTARSKKSTTLGYSVHCRDTYKEEAVKLGLT